MARKKLYNENMGDLIEAVTEYMNAGQSIRAKYAEMAEKEIAHQRERVLDLMFVKHHESGPSEIANTTGISRSTVIRWRKEFLDRAEEAGVPLEMLIKDREDSEADAEERVEPVAGFEFGLEHSAESNTQVHYVKRAEDEFKVYFPVGDFFCEGNTPDEAEQESPISRPDWLTDDLMKQAESETGLRIPYAPWRDK